MLTLSLLVAFGKLYSLSDFWIGTIGPEGWGHEIHLDKLKRVEQLFLKERTVENVYMYKKGLHIYQALSRVFEESKTTSKIEEVVELNFLGKTTGCERTTNCKFNGRWV